MTAPIVEPVELHLDYPFVGWQWHHGIRLEPVTDEELRGVHDMRFPITHGLHDGYAGAAVLANPGLVQPALPRRFGVDPDMRTAGPDGSFR